MLKPADQLAITELYTKYAETMNERKNEEWLSLFCEDGQLLWPALGPEVTEYKLALRGVAQLRGFIETRSAGLGDRPHRNLQNWVSNIDVVGDGETARGRCNLMELGVRIDTGAVEILHLGHYFDELVKQNGKWLISIRTGQ
jgi:hypothetical protein